MSREDRQIERSIRRGMRRQQSLGDQSDDDISDTLVWMVIIGAVVVGGLTFGLGWLDAQFGWNLKESFMAWLNGLFH